MERPHERRATTRTAVVSEAIQAVLDGPNSPSRVVDIGGGTGGFAVRLAKLGHDVTVIDPSPDALAALARRADENEVADRVRGEQGDMAGIIDLIGEQGADLVLCHGVLGLLDEVEVGVADLHRVLQPGGTLSVLVAQRHAAVLARAMAGHFTQAAAVLGGEDPGEHRFTPEELAELLDGAGFTDQQMQAVRVFTDLVPSSLLDLEAGAASSLLELERAVANRPEYFTLAAQLHVLARS